MRRDVVSLNTAYVSLSLLLYLRRPGGRKGRAARKDEVCNWCNICGLQGGINVCSLRALSPSSLFPSSFLPSILPGSERIVFFPYRVVSFFSSSPYPSYI